MPFQKGHKQGKGRPKGSKNKQIMLVEDMVTKLGVDPLEVLMLFAKGDWKALGYETGSTVAYTNAGIEYEKLTITADQRVAAAGQAVKYIYSQKKAMELSSDKSAPFEVIVKDYTKT